MARRWRCSSAARWRFGSDGARCDRRAGARPYHPRADLALGLCGGVCDHGYLDAAGRVIVEPRRTPPLVRGGSERAPPAKGGWGVILGKGDSQWARSSIRYLPSRGRCRCQSWASSSAGLGFTAIELPVRPGYQVEPGNVASELPQAAKILGEYGVQIASVAGNADEPTIAACAEAGVPIIRVMVRVGPGGLPGRGGAAAPRVRRAAARAGTLRRHARRAEPLRPLCRQRHRAMRADRRSTTRRQICAVWDAAHKALNGRPGAGARHRLVAPVHGQPEERLLAAHQRPEAESAALEALLDERAARAGLVAARRRPSSSGAAIRAWSA